MKKKATTIYDIAQLAGVSVPTVSRVLNGRASVGAELRGRVEDAMRELRFRPNRVAQNLNSRRSHTLGCVLPDVTSPYFARLFLEIETCAFERGYTVILGNTANNLELERTYLHSLAERQVDGLLLLGGRANIPSPSAELLRDTREVTERLPIVSVNGDLPGVEGVYSVNSDQRAGTEVLLAYLLARGHTRVAFLGGLPDVTSTLLKLAAYRDFLFRHFPQAPQEWVQLTGFNVQAGEEALSRLLGLPERPTAALCINDLTAAGALVAARSAGVRVPEELSVTGFDDIDIAGIVTPPLTSVNHNYADLARRAVDVLLSAIEGEKPPRLSLVPTFLTPRASVATASVPQLLRGPHV